MNEPLVSIIIPVYNGGNFLKESIDSALTQTYQNIEVIVVNDGSNDNDETERIALSYGEKIRYFHKENGGVATALNLAIREMRGEYFSWLSHDDLYYSNKIARQIQALKDYGDMTAIVHSDYDLLDVSSQGVTHVQHSKLYPTEKITSSVFPVLQGLIHGCSLLIHKSNFERVGTFNENLITTQDYDLWYRMFRYQRTVYINEPLIIGRLHDSQGSRTLKIHDIERDQLYLNFLKEFTENEMISLYNSPCNFYDKMCSFSKGARMKESYKYSNNKLQNAEIPNNISEQLSNLQDFINNISEGNADRICIFGAGEYGIRMYQELRNKLIYVDYFSDNNSEKWGYLFDNIHCISPKQLEKEKNRTLVIVANRTPNGIENQLKLAGFPYVTTKQQMDKVLFDIPPLKWLTSLNSINELDYSSKDIQFLITRFNQVIFDICKYYEDRAKQ